MYVSGDDSIHALVLNDFLTMKPNNIMYVSDTTEEDKEYQPIMSRYRMQKGC